ncbi:hypothetical protein SO802_017468 [Lithocarpus litseifolius]|uniref:Uncharacterized protein n=1 Tax=Lithocarpus litseifolius TaxID=425828 RepID=A0AAW2CI33_9ROSI
MFARPGEGPFPPGFDPSKKGEHHFGVEGHTLEECYHLRDRVQDFIDNKLIQFDNAATPNIITNPLPPYQERNVNAIITVEERVLDFSSSSFPWKAMLRALVQENHLNLREGVIIRMPKSFPYEDNYCVPWKYDVSLISTQTRKEEVYSNISSSLSRLTRSGRYYTPEELEKRRKEIGVTESSFEGMVLMVLATNQISFTDDELPPKGREHTLPMHIMRKEKEVHWPKDVYPYIKVTFLAPAEVIRLEMAQEWCKEELDLACLIRLCLEEFSVNAIISPGG